MLNRVRILATTIGIMTAASLLALAASDETIAAVQLQLGDLLYQIDRPHDQPHLRFFVFFARVVVHADKSLETHLRFPSVGDAHIICRPGDAAGEVGNLDRRIAIEFALHVPVEHLRLGVREGGVQHVELIGMREKFQLDARRVDERVGPRELKRVDSFLESHLPRLADQRDVLAVVDRELNSVPAGDGREIDVLGQRHGAPEGPRLVEHAEAAPHPLAAFRVDADLKSVRASCFEVYGEHEPPPEASLDFRGFDPRVGAMTKYTLIDTNADRI